MRTHASPLAAVPTSVGSAGWWVGLPPPRVPRSPPVVGSRSPGLCPWAFAFGVALPGWWGWPPFWRFVCSLSLCWGGGRSGGASGWSGRSPACSAAASRFFLLLVVPGFAACLPRPRCSPVRVPARVWSVRARLPWFGSGPRSGWSRCRGSRSVSAAGFWFWLDPGPGLVPAAGSGFVVAVVAGGLSGCSGSGGCSRCCCCSVRDRPAPQSQLGALPSV